MKSLTWFLMLARIIGMQRFLVARAKRRKSKARSLNNTWWVESLDSETALVFVHGILSNSTECWTYRDGNDGSNDRFWPEMVAQDPRFAISETGTKEQRTRVSVFLGGYYTALDAGRYNAEDCSKELFQGLRRNGVLSKANILFICHSTGGIVVRQMLLDHKDLFRGKAVGLLLIASPSLGSPWASRLKFPAWIYNNVLAQELASDSSYLESLDSQFKNCLHNDTWPTLCGHEGAETRFIIHRKFLPDKQLVVPYSSTGRYFEVTRLPGLDHSQAVKPDSHSHPGYMLLADFFEQKFVPLLSRRKLPRQLPKGRARRRQYAERILPEAA